LNDGGSRGERRERMFAPLASRARWKPRSSREEKRTMTMAMPRVTQLASNWWALALRGGVAILFGVLALARPGVTFAAIVVVLSAYLFVDGVIAIMAAIRGIRAGDQWGWLMVSGILGIVAGTLALFNPLTGAVVLAWIIALWAIMHGIFEILAGVKLRKLIEGEWLLIVAGVLALALGIYILMRPSAGAALLVTWVGVYALVVGILTFMLAFRVRKWSREHPA
jgi:uncharacterized membrane protein HdeD (DUF308 family)